MKSPYFYSFAAHFAVILTLALWSSPKKPLLPPAQTIQVRFRAQTQAPLPEVKKEEAPVPPKVKKTEKPVPPGPKLVDKIKPKKKVARPKKEAVEEPKTPPKNNLPAPENTPFGETVLENANFPYSYYLEQMLNKIDQRWENPVRSDLPLSTVIYFRIQKSGNVTDLQIEAPSGIALFDNACRRAILSADPLPPLPAEFPESYLGVHLEFKQ